jgi:hypothetical protein
MYVDQSGPLNRYHTRRPLEAWPISEEPYGKARTYSSKPCRKNLFHSVPDHVPANAYCTTASGVLVGNFRRSRPKTSLSRPQVLYILLELDLTAWFSTAL